MKYRTLILLFFVASICSAQDTWYGEIAFAGGGGKNDIFRFNELEGAGSFTGDGTWVAAAEVRRIFGNWLSLEFGAGYAHQYYHTTPAPGLGNEETPGSFGVINIPAEARVDFLRWFFVSAGPLVSFQTGSSRADNMSGLGLTASAGLQYNFKSDFFIRVRAYASQYALLQFMPSDYPQTMYNSGLMAGVGYRFIHLGKCNCPESNAQHRRFF